MKYICVECKRTFEVPVVWYEDRGEFWGSSCSERMTGLQTANKAE